jgi:hypothetical protein
VQPQIRSRFAPGPDFKEAPAPALDVKTGEYSLDKPSIDAHRGLEASDISLHEKAIQPGPPPSFRVSKANTADFGNAGGEEIEVSALTPRLEGKSDAMGATSQAKEAEAETEPSHKRMVDTHLSNERKIEGEHINATLCNEIDPIATRSLHHTSSAPGTATTPALTKTGKALSDRLSPVHHDSRPLGNPPPCSSPVHAEIETSSHTESGLESDDKPNSRERTKKPRSSRGKAAPRSTKSSESAKNFLIRKRDALQQSSTANTRSTHASDRAPHLATPGPPSDPRTPESEHYGLYAITPDLMASVGEAPARLVSPSAHPKDALHPQVRGRQQVDPAESALQRPSQADNQTPGSTGAAGVMEKPLRVFPELAGHGSFIDDLAIGPTRARNEEPGIKVSIGRIEVRADMPPERPPAKPARQRKGPTLSLDEYLSRRSRGRG